MPPLVMLRQRDAKHPALSPQRSAAFLEPLPGGQTKLPGQNPVSPAEQTCDNERHLNDQGKDTTEDVVTIEHERHFGCAQWLGFGRDES
jgi:hypothetical protein